MNQALIFLLDELKALNMLSIENNKKGPLADGPR